MEWCEWGCEDIGLGGMAWRHGLWGSGWIGRRKDVVLEVAKEVDSFRCIFGLRARSIYFDEAVVLTPLELRSRCRSAG